MTERRPAGMSTGSWIEAQVNRAQRDGHFDDLPGMGKPIPDLLKPETEFDMAAKIARQQGVDASVFLPPSLALAKEVEDLPERLQKIFQEHKVREHLEDLNERIGKERIKPQNGPPFRTRKVDIEDYLSQWRATRPAPVVRQTEPEPKKRWFRRA